MVSKIFNNINNFTLSDDVRNPILKVKLRDLYLKEVNEGIEQVFLCFFQSLSVYLCIFYFSFIFCILYYRIVDCTRIVIVIGACFLFYFYSYFYFYCILYSLIVYACIKDVRVVKCLFFFSFQFFRCILNYNDRYCSLV